MKTTNDWIKGMELAAKRGAQYNIEALSEELIPTLMVLTKNNNVEVAHVTAPKEEMADVIKDWLLKRQAKAYILILEAWSTNFVDEALEKYDGRVANMPLDDRFEVTTIIIVKKDEGVIQYLSARIDTDLEGHRKLREWSNGNVQETRICVTEW